MTVAGPKAAARGIHPSAALLRGFAVEFLTAHDLAAVARIMTPDYRLTIGGHVLEGRDNVYLPATAAQLEVFPGLGVTVHDIVLGEGAAALRFTEHGASLRQGGPAAWGGVVLFRIAGAQLRAAWAEEDYWGRKQQFDVRACDPIEPPHPDPWSVKPAPPNPAADDLARDWLMNPGMLRDAGERGAPFCGPPPAALIQGHETQINELFSAGNRVAFHVHCRGAYAGGFADIDASLIGSDATLRVAGLLTVVDEKIAAVRLVTDRLGLHRALRAASA